LEAPDSDSDAGIHFRSVQITPPILETGSGDQIYQFSRDKPQNWPETGPKDCVSAFCPVLPDLLKKGRTVFGVLRRDAYE
jgi:hypothetical protein